MAYRSNGGWLARLQPRWATNSVVVKYLQTRIDSAIPSTRSSLSPEVDSKRCADPVTPLGPTITHAAVIFHLVGAVVGLPFGEDYGKALTCRLKEVVARTFGETLRTPPRRGARNVNLPGLPSAWCCNPSLEWRRRFAWTRVEGKWIFLFPSLRLVLFGAPSDAQEVNDHVLLKPASGFSWF